MCYTCLCHKYAHVFAEHIGKVKGIHLLGALEWNFSGVCHTYYAVCLIIDQLGRLEAAPNAQVMSGDDLLSGTPVNLSYSDVSHTDCTSDWVTAYIFADLSSKVPHVNSFLLSQGSDSPMRRHAIIAYVGIRSVFLH